MKRDRQPFRLRTATTAKKTTTTMLICFLVLLLAAAISSRPTAAFSVVSTTRSRPVPAGRCSSSSSSSFVALFMSWTKNENKETGAAAAAAAASSSNPQNVDAEETILGPLAAAVKQIEEDEAADESTQTAAAATGTVNERLRAELREAAQREKYGARSPVGRKMGLLGGLGRSSSDRKTDAEREAAMAEARDLNGVNPAVALAGSAFALAAAAGLWALTGWLAEYFALHPVAPDQAYFVARVTAVVRNVVTGLVALASGFFGVTGLGIFLLGVRVAYGVATGELDPTPVPKKKGSAADAAADQEKAVDMAKMWDLMTNKNQKRGRR